MKIVFSMRDGWSWEQAVPDNSNVRLSMRQVSILFSPEVMNHLLKNNVSASMCPTVGQNKEGSATETLDVDVGKKELSTGILRDNGTSLTLQEATENVEHDLLTNRLHVTHFGGCASRSRSFLRRQSSSGQKFSTVSPRVNSNYAKKAWIRKKSSPSLSAP